MDISRAPLQGSIKPDAWVSLFIFNRTYILSITDKIYMYIFVSPARRDHKSVVVGAVGVGVVVRGVTLLVSGQ